jgi:hypothetical protein
LREQEEAREILEVSMLDFGDEDDDDMVHQAKPVQKENISTAKIVSTTQPPPSTNTQKVKAISTRTNNGTDSSAIFNELQGPDFDMDTSSSGTATPDFSTVSKSCFSNKSYSHH